MNAEDFRLWSAGSQVAMCVLKDGKVLLVNSQFERTTGYAEWELVGMDLSSLLTLTDSPADETPPSSAQMALPEVRLLSKTGEVRWVSPAFTPVDFDDAPALLACFLDVTERRRAEQESRSNSGKLLKLLESTADAIAFTLQMRDPYTAAHQRRVTQLACAMGQDMGLPGSQLETIRLAGLLHDIGKIHIPAEILSKPDRLGSNELGIMKTHPQAGYDILKRIDFPWPVAQAVLQHHERLDGSGYPSGIKGEGILLEARMLGVADVVEAINSHRPYRAALGIQQALAEIADNKGRLYDPAAVEVCVKLFEERGFRFEDVSLS